MKIGYKIIIATLLIGIVLGTVFVIIDNREKMSLKKHIIDKYNFEISYPDAYIDNSKSGDEGSKILSNIASMESGEQISEYMQNLNFVETVKDLKNSENGIKLIIEAIKKEKTKLELEEICSRYVAMFKVYNENANIKETKKEIVNLDNKKVGKVTINIKGKKSDSRVIAYLISLDDREITVTFIAPEVTAEKYEKQINDIINSIKFY